MEERHKTYYDTTRLLLINLIIIDIKADNCNYKIINAEDVYQYILDKYQKPNTNIDKFCINGNINKDLYLDMISKDELLLHGIAKYFR
jgi:3-deoxy-D-arabino-heptulosonate 7-phosphate (DAHP) synthase